MKRAIIIGAGPAGLTAAYELMERTDILPIILEQSNDIGGISKTINYKGNRIDLGGHRFFSKSDRVMQWWQRILPLQGAPSKDDLLLDIAYHGRRRKITLSENGPDPEKVDRVMLVRKRLSRIFFLRRFFNYPVSLSLDTLKNLGFIKVIRIAFSYLYVRVVAPVREERTLEDFFIKRFGKELYTTFFEDYTEKVWGVPCNQISAEWGAQRIKGLSFTKAVTHALRRLVPKRHSLEQKNTETTLIEQFLYPKHGPGQMWEEVARAVKDRGAQVHLNHQVVGINQNQERIESVTVKDVERGTLTTIAGDYFFSTMAIKDLASCMNGPVPSDVRATAQGLVYRDFLTVGLLLKKLKIKNETNIPTVNDIVPDNWIYVQERDVKVGRLQIFNNWSPYMVHDLNTVWMGLEYFCNEGDEVWRRTDAELKDFAIDELVKIGLANREDVLDGTVIRMPKTYPAYFGSYKDFHIVRKYLDHFENLFLIGRNGMHRYNNQDHSMLTAMIAVENIAHGIASKDNIWSVNTEEEYHEENKQDN
jgi:protoporphyrinogen oxidase